jgi:hypothetical protein
MNTDSVLIENSTNLAMKVWLEPYAIEFEIEPGHTLKVSADSEEEGSFEIERHEPMESGYSFTVWGWFGANLLVHDNDLEVFSCDLRFPVLSTKRRSLKSVINQLFNRKP